MQEGTESENPEEVILFSGGLDSLGGAVQQSVLDGQKVVLVHHQSTDAMETRRQDLMNSLVEKSQQPPIYIPVSIRKDKSLSHEYTQRSRSFLYAALGTTVAQMWNLSRIRFYENGVVSLNLPICGEVVGARATRTTHPRVLDGFARLFSEIAGREFSVENPFLWKTKTEVLELIGSAGCSELIQYTTSCTRTREMTIAKPHCGACSQCIDRRFAVLAAGLESADPESEYRVDLLSGERNKEDSLAMLVSYIQMSREISTMDTGGFFAHYGEVGRVLQYMGIPMMLQLPRSLSCIRDMPGKSRMSLGKALKRTAPCSPVGNYRKPVCYAWRPVRLGRQEQERNSRNQNWRIMFSGEKGKCRRSDLLGVKFSIFANPKVWTTSASFYRILEKKSLQWNYIPVPPRNWLSILSVNQVLDQKSKESCWSKG